MEEQHCEEETHSGESYKGLAGISDLGWQAMLLPGRDQGVEVSLSEGEARQAGL